MFPHKFWDIFFSFLNIISWEEHGAILWLRQMSPWKFIWCLIRRQTNASAESVLLLGETLNQYQANQAKEDGFTDLDHQQIQASGPRRDHGMAIPSHSHPKHPLWAFSSFCHEDNMRNLGIHKHGCTWQYCLLKCYNYKVWGKIKQAISISCVSWAAHS